MSKQAILKWLFHAVTFCYTPHNQAIAGRVVAHSAKALALYVFFWKEIYSTNSSLVQCEYLYKTLHTIFFLQV